MKRMIFPSLEVTSLSTLLSRSSNSPRYLAPATSAPRSSASTRLPARLSGTSPEAIRRAIPSTMAVLPTPGSPMSTGLFFVRRASTCIARRISSSRPMTGSRLPRRASSVRSLVYLSSAWYVASGSALVTRWLPRRSRSARSTTSRDRPSSSSSARAGERSSSSIASSMCSVEMYSSLSRLASAAAASSRSLSSRPMYVSPPLTSGTRSSEAASRPRNTPGLTPARSMSAAMSPPSCVSSASRRCSGVTSWWLCLRVAASAAVSASRAFVVNRSSLIAITLTRCRSLSGSRRCRSRRPSRRPRRAARSAARRARARSPLDRPGRGDRARRRCGSNR